MDREISTTKKIGMLEYALEQERKVDLIALWCVIQLSNSAVKYSYKNPF